METMCPSDYHHNGFVANHALGLLMYVNIYIYIYIYITFEYIIVQSANKISCDSLSNLKSY